MRLSLALITSCCLASLSHLAAVEADWTDLFADNDFSQWQQVGGGDVGGGWKINDGVVERDRILAGNICTRESFSDFELVFEWKISEGGNSGVKYRTRKSLGLEYQVLDDQKHSDGKKPSHRAASLYNLLAAPDSKPINPPGEWNKGRIIARGNTIEHWLNDELVVATTIGTEDWQERFKKSKYKNHDGFGTWNGPILLQDHGDRVWYRNLKIRRLEKE